MIHPVLQEMNLFQELNYSCIIVATYITIVPRCYCPMRKVFSFAFRLYFIPLLQITTNHSTDMEFYEYRKSDEKYNANNANIYIILFYLKINFFRNT